ncbi:zinc finger MYM-type protein 1-like [Macrobrachium rosenbergii]|uniref:zinc finger MYM-type protein 1-like n=1 Tax=Macrobrachium rosenbergii TaxID=79674 RepID=UPI0034D55AD3
MLPELQYPNDPAHVVTYKIRISESFIKLCNNYGPCQPVISYPKNLEGRSFQKKWYEKNSWLEYSPQKDAMFCFSCRLFLTEERYSGRVAWKSEGISRWRTALEKIKEHAGSESHMIGMVRWKGFQSQALDIALETANREVQAARDKEKQRNREILDRLISITLYLARQGLPFRGDGEISTSENRGNFLELVEMFSKTQNDLIKALAISVRRVILEEIHQSKVFSILMDETTDVSHTEQVSFVVRYVHDFKIKERFIQVFNVQSTTGEALEKEVISMLKANNLNIDDMRGQGYDGAANMSGIYNGLHLVEKLYAFVANSSKRHAAFMEIQKAMYPEDRPLELQKLSDTRWACRESALRTMKKVIPALKQFLEEIVQKDPPDTSAGEASILLKSINFEFLVCLEIATPVFQETAYASNALQLKDLDLAASYRIVDGVLQSLRELRNDEKFQEIFTKVKDRAESMAINLPSVIPGQGRRRKMPERYKYSATSATTEDQQYQTLDDYYRVRVFYVFLDKISQELQRRFKDGDNTTRGILKAFHYMTVQDNWKEPVNEEAFKSLQKLCQFYELEEVDKLQLELKIFIPHFLAIHRTLQLQCST